MHPANPFAGHELHSPQLTADEATRIARERFGVEVVAPPRLLGSHQDQNFLPPLVFQERDADRVGDALERVLSDGW